MWGNFKPVVNDRGWRLADDPSDEMKARVAQYRHCPACDKLSLYDRATDRFFHSDGSRNVECWVEISSGQASASTNHRHEPARADAALMPESRAPTSSKAFRPQGTRRGPWIRSIRTVCGDASATVNHPRKPRDRSSTNAAQSR
jgi:hypothetical protein